MMTLASMALTQIVGPWLRWLVLPVLGIGLLTASHQAVHWYNEALRMQGERRCDARWEAEIREQERARLAGQIETTRTLLANEQRTTQELRDDGDRLRAEMEELRAAAGSSDASCVSKRVLDTVRQRGGVEPGKAPKPARAGS